MDAFRIRDTLLSSNRTHYEYYAAEIRWFTTYPYQVLSAGHMRKLKYWRPCWGKTEGKRKRNDVHAWKLRTCQNNQVHSTFCRVSVMMLFQKRGNASLQEYLGILHQVRTADRLNTSAHTGLVWSDYNLRLASDQPTPSTVDNIAVK